MSKRLIGFAVLSTASVVGLVSTVLAVSPNFISTSTNAGFNHDKTTRLRTSEVLLAQSKALPPAACPPEGCIPPDPCDRPNPPPFCDPDPSPQPSLNLTGKWKADDGGTYYLRTIGNQLWWYGESSPTNPGWSNILTGTIQGNQINGNWADVPKGSILGNGSMQVRIVSSNKLQAISKSGSGFGGSVWTR